MKWEYTTYFVSEAPDRVEASFNKLGAMGWELVTIDRGIAYFKRPIQDVELVRSSYKDWLNSQ